MNVMGHAAELAECFEDEANVRYELYDETTDGGATIRLVDIDTGNVARLTRYPTKAGARQAFWAAFEVATGETRPTETVAYDYDKQAWVVGGRYVRCGHVEACDCYGRAHEGETAVLS